RAARLAGHRDVRVDPVRRPGHGAGHERGRGLHLRISSRGSGPRAGPRRGDRRRDGGRHSRLAPRTAAVARRPRDAWRRGRGGRPPALDSGRTPTLPPSRTRARTATPPRGGSQLVSAEELRAKIGTDSQAGTAGMRIKPRPAMPAATTGKPTRTKRSCGTRADRRAWVHDPAVHETVAAVRAMPAPAADQPRTSTRSSATYASTVKKAIVNRPRRRTAVG